MVGMDISSKTQWLLWTIDQPMGMSYTGDEHIRKTPQATGRVFWMISSWFLVPILTHTWLHIPSRVHELVCHSRLRFFGSFGLGSRRKRLHANLSHVSRTRIWDQHGPTKNVAPTMLT